MSAIPIEIQAAFREGETPLQALEDFSSHDKKIANRAMQISAQACYWLVFGQQDLTEVCSIWPW